MESRLAGCTETFRQIAWWPNGISTLFASGPFSRAGIRISALIRFESRFPKTRRRQKRKIPRSCNTFRRICVWNSSAGDELRNDVERRLLLVEVHSEGVTGWRQNYGRYGPALQSRIRGHRVDYLSRFRGGPLAHSIMTFLEIPEDTETVAAASDFSPT